MALSAANASPIVASCFDGRNPSGTTPSPLGVTRLVTVPTPAMAESWATVSRSRASEAGASMFPETPASIRPVDWTSLPLPMCAATTSKPAFASEPSGSSAMVSKLVFTCGRYAAGTRRAAISAIVTMPGCRDTIAARRAKNPPGSPSGAGLSCSGQNR